MPAFSVSRALQIEKAIDELYNRSAWHARLQLEHKDILSLFVREEHRKPLIELTKECNISGHGTCFQFKMDSPQSQHTATVVVQVYDAGNKKAFPIPEYCNEGFALDANEELKAKVQKWLDFHLTLVRDFGRLKALSHHLNTTCSTPAAVRYVWPGVLALIGMDPDAQDYVDKLRPFKVPGSLPRISPELRDFAKETAGRIVQAQLLPQVSLEDTLPPVRVWCAVHRSGVLPGGEKLVGSLM